MFLQIDGTLIVQLVNFVVFIVLLNIVFLKPVGAAIAKRRAYINGLAHDIEAGEAEIKAARGQADERRASARREVDASIARARTAAQNEASAVAGEYQDRANAIVAEAQRKVDAEVASARTNEDQVVDSIARTMVERAMGSEAVV